MVISKKIKQMLTCSFVIIEIAGQWLQVQRQGLQETDWEDLNVRQQDAENAVGRDDRLDDAVDGSGGWRD